MLLDIPLSNASMCRPVEPHEVAFAGSVNRYFLHVVIFPDLDAPFVGSFHHHTLSPCAMPHHGVNSRLCLVKELWGFGGEGL
jgi:hypothetical protein